MIARAGTTFRSPYEPREAGANIDTDLAELQQRLLMISLEMAPLA